MLEEKKRKKKKERKKRERYERKSTAEADMQWGEGDTERVERGERVVSSHENTTLPCCSFCTGPVEDEEAEAEAEEEEEEEEEDEEGERNRQREGQPFRLRGYFLAFLETTTLTERITGKNCFALIPREFDVERKRASERERERERERKRERRE